VINRRKAAVGLLLLPVFSYAQAKVGRDAFNKAQKIFESSFASKNAGLREKAVTAVADTRFPKDADLLKKALNDENEYVRIAAAKSLAKKGDATGSVVLQDILLHTPEPSTQNPVLYQFQSIAVASKRSAAARALGTMSDPGARTALKQARAGKDARVRDAAAVELDKLGEKTELVVFHSALGDKDDGVRKAAMDALADIASPDSETHFANGLSDPAGDVRIGAVQGLKKIKATNRWRDVASLVHDNNALARETVAETLGAFGEKGALPTLKILLEDSNGFVRVAAAKSLAQLGDRSGAAFVTESLGAEDADMRMRAADALGAFADEKDWGALVPLLDDPEERVSQAAALSLWKKASLR